MPEKEGASIRTHSLVSSQEIAVCHHGNRPKTRVLFCRSAGVFRNFILARIGQQQQTFPVGWKLQCFGKTNGPFAFGSIRIKPGAGFSEQPPRSLEGILPGRPADEPTCCELLPFQTLPWTCGRVFLDPGPYLKSCFVNFGDLEKKYQLADVRNVGEISSLERSDSCRSGVSVLPIQANDLLAGREAVVAVGLIVLRGANCVLLQMRKFSLPFPSPSLATDCRTMVLMPAKRS